MDVMCTSTNYSLVTCHKFTSNILAKVETPIVDNSSSLGASNCKMQDLVISKC